MQIRRTVRVVLWAVMPLAVALLSVAVAACAGGGAGAGDEGQETTVTRSIQDVQEARTPEWMALPGVVGTGIGLCDGVPCIKVFVSRRTPELEEEIPGEVEGYRVQIEETGPFRARDTTPDV